MVRDTCLMTPDSIKSCRVALGLSQEAFAERIGVAPRSVCRWENGQAKPSGAAAKAIFDLAGGMVVGVDPAGPGPDQTVTTTFHGTEIVAVEVGPPRVGIVLTEPITDQVVIGGARGGKALRAAQRKLAHGVTSVGPAATEADSRISYEDFEG